VIPRRNKTIAGYELEIDYLIEIEIWNTILAGQLNMPGFIKRKYPHGDSVRSSEHYSIP
jgi:hypothetical protein